MAEHNTLTDPNLHEPKGASTASSGYVMRADGAGSTSWVPLLNNTTIAYAQIYTQVSDAETLGTIGTTEQTLPFTTDGVENGADADAANNRIVVATAGVYEVSFNGSFATVDAADAGTYTFNVCVNGTPSVLEAVVELTGTTDTSSVVVSGLLTLAATDVVTVEVESDEAGNTDDLSIVSVRLFVKLVRAT